MIKYSAIILSLILLTISSDIVQAYEVREVKNGAILRGIVKFTGDVPEDETVTVNTDVEYCGKEQKLGKYSVHDSMVKNTVVWIEDIKAGKPLLQKGVEILFKNCRVEPLVNVGFVGGNYIFRNEDVILRTVQLKLWLEYQKKVSGRPLKDGATIYNLAFPKKDMRIERPVKGYHAYGKDKGYVQIKSNIHDWIRGYVFVFDHPYASVTDEKGSFILDGLPPGEYLLKVWHEGFGMQERKIKVMSGEIQEVEIEFSP